MWFDRLLLACLRSIREGSITAEESRRRARVTMRRAPWNVVRIFAGVHVFKDYHRLY